MTDDKAREVAARIQRAARLAGFPDAVVTPVRVDRITREEAQDRESDARRRVRDRMLEHAASRRN